MCVSQSKSTIAITILIDVFLEQSVTKTFPRNVDNPSIISYNPSGYERSEWSLGLILWRLEIRV